MFQYLNGSIVTLVTMPEWLKDALLAEQEDDDRARALSDQGAEQIESYGTLCETIDVWRRVGYGWLIDWWDVDSHVMSILVKTRIDFALFQAAWIAPMAVKIMAADAYLRDRSERQYDAEKATSPLH